MSGNSPDKQNRPSFLAADWVPRPRHLVWLLMVVVILYAVGLNRHWRVQRDGALYLCLGRSLAEGQGYTYNHKPHTLALPGFPLMIAGVVRAFDMDCAPDRVLPLNAMMALIGVGCIAVTYLLFREMRVPGETLLAVLLMVGLSRQMYYYSAQIMTDVPFTFLVILGLWAAVRVMRSESRAFWLWCLCAALLSMAATAVRPLGPTVVAALVAALWLRPGARRKWRRNLLATLFIGAICALPLVIWLIHDLNVGSAKDSYIRSVLSVHGEGAFRSMLWVCRQIPSLLEALGETITGVGLGVFGGLPLAVLVLIGLIRMARTGEWLLPAYVIIFVFVVCFGGRMGRRYLVPALAVLCYAFVIGSQEVTGWMMRKNILSPLRRRHLLVLGLAAVLVMNLVRIGKVVVVNRSPNFYGRFEKGRWARYMDAGSWLNDNADPKDRVTAYETRLLHFLTRLRLSSLPGHTAAGPEVRRKALLRDNIRYVVLDDRKARDATVALDALFQQHPGAAECVFEKDGLRIMRVLLEKLGPARPTKQETTDRRRYVTAIQTVASCATLWPQGATLNRRLGVQRLRIHTPKLPLEGATQGFPLSESQSVCYVIRGESHSATCAG